MRERRGRQVTLDLDLLGVFVLIGGCCRCAVVVGGGMADVIRTASLNLTISLRLKLSSLSFLAQ
jgi:hypothetical protein